MEYIISGKRCGKTAQLIKESAEKQIYILVKDRKRQDILWKQAREMGITDMPYPVTFEDFQRSRFHGSFIRKILIDDADDILKSIFYTVEIEAITMSVNEWDNLKISQEDYERFVLGKWKDKGEE